jgi:hypothetical protein
MNVLKNAVLEDLINKKEELMREIMANPNVNRAIDTAKNAAAAAAAAKDMGTAAVSNLTGRFSSFGRRL